MLANCGHVPPIVSRRGGKPERLALPAARGLGGRAAPKPANHSTSLEPGDRLLMVSDGVVKAEKGKAGLGINGLVAAALRSERASAADTVRKVHMAVLDQARGELDDELVPRLAGLGGVSKR